MVKAAALGYRVDQVPASWVNRQIGRSNFRLYREFTSYTRWLALGVVCMPSRWTILAGLSLPLLIRPVARRLLLADSRRIAGTPDTIANRAEISIGLGETKR